MSVHHAIAVEKDQGKQNKTENESMQDYEYPFP